MPLLKKILPNLETQILIWEITESVVDLSDKILLNETSLVRLKKMKSTQHQQAFLSVRKLLEVAGYTDFDLFYDALGKPFFKNNKHISITHSHPYSAIIISTQEVGIDIEKQQEKILKLAPKFVLNEFYYINPEKKLATIKKLTVIWCTKEAVFKIINKVGISFKNDIKVNGFEENDIKTKALFLKENQKQIFDIFIENISNFILVYTFKQKND